MCVHLFGAVSSPSRSNYALKRTAVDNSSSFGLDASETVMKNFYVDDLLKSVKSEEYAVDLIKKSVLQVVLIWQSLFVIGRMC